MSLKHSNDTIGNRTRDLPVCSVVPHVLRIVVIFKNGSITQNIWHRMIGLWRVIIWGRWFTIARGLFKVTCHNLFAETKHNLEYCTGQHSPRMDTNLHLTTLYPCRLSSLERELIDTVYGSLGTDDV